MILMPMVFVTNMKRSLEFYTALGSFKALAQSDVWSEISVGAEAVIALHAAEHLPEETERLGLNLTTKEPLEEVVARLEQQGITSKAGILEEDFGRAVVFHDPDGLSVQINERNQLH